MGFPVLLPSNGLSFLSKYSSTHRYLMEIFTVFDRMYPSASLHNDYFTVVGKLPCRGQRQFITVNMISDFYWTLYFFYCDQSDAVIVW